MTEIVTISYGPNGVQIATASGRQYTYMNAKQITEELARRLSGQESAASTLLKLRAAVSQDASRDEIDTLLDRLEENIGL